MPKHTHKETKRVPRSGKAFGFVAKYKTTRASFDLLRRRSKREPDVSLSTQQWFLELKPNKDTPGQLLDNNRCCEDSKETQRGVVTVRGVTPRSAALRRPLVHTTLDVHQDCSTHAFAIICNQGFSNTGSLEPLPA